MMMRHWSSKYIGTKYHRRTMNCASLVELVYRQELGQLLSLPKIEDYSAEGLDRTLDCYFIDYCAPTDHGPREFDIALMKSWNHFNHVGIFCFLHRRAHILHAFAAARQVVLTAVDRLSSYQLTLDGAYKCR